MPLCTLYFSNDTIYYHKLNFLTLYNEVLLTACVDVFSLFILNLRNPIYPDETTRLNPFFYARPKKVIYTFLLKTTDVQLFRYVQCNVLMFKQALSIKNLADRGIYSITIGSNDNDRF